MPLESLYKYALLFQFVVSPLIFIALIFISAPYGKFSRTGWGPRINSLTAWMLMEVPAAATILVCALVFRDTISWGWVFLGIWEFHYLYRTFYFPLRMNHGRKTFPLSMAVSAMVFNVINGFINGVFLFRLRPTVDPSWFLDPRFLIGLLIFLTGFLIHYDSDRRIQAQKPGPGHYIIPQGGMYRWISGPNYFGEILQWFGWALLTWSPAGLAFAVFTFANIFPRAISGHKWYKSNFKEYPAERKAIIPGLV